MGMVWSTYGARDWKNGVQEGKEEEREERGREREEREKREERGSFLANQIPTAEALRDGRGCRMPRCVLLFPSWMMM